MKCPHTTTVKSRAGFLVCCQCQETIASPPPYVLGFHKSTITVEDDSLSPEARAAMAKKVADWHAQDCARRLVERLFPRPAPSPEQPGTVTVRRLGSGKDETFFRAPATCSA